MSGNELSPIEPIDVHHMVSFLTARVGDAIMERDGQSGREVLDHVMESLGKVTMAAEVLDDRRDKIPPRDAAYIGEKWKATMGLDDETIAGARRALDDSGAYSAFFTSTMKASHAHAPRGDGSRQGEMFIDPKQNSHLTDADVPGGYYDTSHGVITAIDGLSQAGFGSAYDHAHEVAQRPDNGFLDSHSWTL